MECERNLISIRKRNPETEDFLTIINIKAQPSDLEFNNILADLCKYLFRVAIAVKNFDYLVEPKTVKINDNLAGYALFSYTILDENQNQTKVVSAIWVFPMKDFFYLIGSGMVNDNFEPILDEIKQILGTFKIKKR
ncbi:hypothetical protein [Leptospira brenneri]|uniref:hypothetical protein n=1 Tax=Leptospira brenneri TaxID=2023182 RepID=UPI0013FDEAC1|nr:hypothetical protein [Leptospira brenneri]